MIRACDQAMTRQDDLLPPLYLIADRATCKGRSLPVVLHEAIRGGVSLIQFREKQMDRGDHLKLAVQVRAVTSDSGIRLMINSDVEAARSVGAEGVHLPADRIREASAARDRLGSGALVGASVHSAAELAIAEACNVDFVVFSPVFQPGSKSFDGELSGIEGLREAVGITGCPVYALGGVTPERTATCREAGAFGVAAMSGILAAEEPALAAERYLEAWEKAG